MKNDIKEINITFPGQILDYVDTKEHLLELFNYITNLQEENKRLKDDKKKVLELIENDYFEFGSFENEYEVLNILKGE